MAQVKIGPEFFAKELREYSDWRWGIVREAMQNSIDARGSDRIEVEISEQDGNTIFTWSNNGKSMDLDTIENKLLCLGGTGKEFSGTVGGFGKAKTLLYFAHESYTIRTGSLVVKGRGGDYTVTECPFYLGTKSTVVLKGSQAAALVSACKRFCQLAQWDGHISVRSDSSTFSSRPALHKGRWRKDFSFGKVYTNRSFENLLVVRIGGVPMFTRHTNLNRCVVVELSGSSVERLTSNRDSLLHSYNYELQDFITRLAVDRRSALDSNFEEKKVYGNVCMSYTSRLAESAIGKMPPELASEVLGGSPNTVAALTASASESSSSGSGSASAGPSVDKSMFVVLNKTGHKVPAHYLPGSFGAYARKLSKIWTNILVELHDLCDRSAVFAVGFVFDHRDEDAALALYEKDGVKNLYYINPTLSKFKKRLALTDRDKIIAYAVHEFVHGEHRYHDESYAAELTNMMALVMKNRKRFNKCFVVD